MAQVTPSDPFRLGVGIPEDLFEQELRKKGAYESPLFNGITDKPAAARQAYRDIVAGGHSPEVFLGIMGKEHQWGTAANSVLRRNDTRSMGNARSCRTPGMPHTIVTDPVRGSQYCKYLNFNDSVRDFVYRINDPTYAYAGKTTIAEVVRVIAPAEDSNDPEGYAWFIANYATGLRSRMTDPVPGGDTSVIPFVAADSRHYTRGRTVAWPDIFVFHHTDGYDSLAWLTTSPNSNVSATYLLNHDGSIRAQLVKHEDTPHTTGNINPRTISFEWERKWGDPTQATITDAQYGRLAKSAARVWLIERARGNPHFAGLPSVGQFEMHKQFGNTTCPGNLDPDRVWREALPIVQSGGNMEEIVEVPGVGTFTVKGWFYDKWVSRGRSAGDGLPLTDEFQMVLEDGQPHTVQYFERARYEVHPFGVLLGRVGWELLNAPPPGPVTGIDPAAVAERMGVIQQSADVVLFEAGKIKEMAAKPFDPAA